MRGRVEGRKGMRGQGGDTTSPQQLILDTSLALWHQQRSVGGGGGGDSGGDGGGATW